MQSEELEPDPSEVIEEEEGRISMVRALILKGEISPREFSEAIEREDDAEEEVLMCGGL